MQTIFSRNNKSLSWSCLDFVPNSSKFKSLKTALKYIAFCLSILVCLFVQSCLFRKAIFKYHNGVYPVLRVHIHVCRQFLKLIIGRHCQRLATLQSQNDGLIELVLYLIWHAVYIFRRVVYWLNNDSLY